MMRDSSQSRNPAVRLLAVAGAIPLLGAALWVAALRYGAGPAVLVGVLVAVLYAAALALAGAIVDLLDRRALGDE